MRTIHKISAELDEARSRRSALASDLAALVANDDAYSASGSFRSGHKTRYDRLSAGVGKLDDEVASLDSEWRSAMYAGMASGEFEIESGDNCGSPASRSTASPWAPTPSYGAGNETRGRALTAIERDAHASPGARERATRAIEADESDVVAKYVTAVSDPAYLRAFRTLVADVERGHLTWGPAERDAVQNVGSASRAMSLDPGSAGGFAVPFSLDPTFLLTGNGSVNPIREIARVETVATDSWNGITTAGASASWAGEGVEVGDNSPTLARPPVPIHKAHAFVPFSVEVSADVPNFVEQVSSVLLDARDQLEATTFVTGTGTGQPTGIVTALAGTGSEIDSGTADTFALDDVYALIEALPPRFRAAARWLAPLEIVNLVRRFATANNYSAFLTDLAGGNPPAMLGKPLHEASGLDGTITAEADNRVLVVGDFASYVVADRIGATMEIVPHLFGENGRPTGQRGAYLYWRTGADVVNPNGLRMLNVT
jgi:HK97 family phage major capsid protein